jgi:predicted glycosyltransferase
VAGRRVLFYSHDGTGLGHLRITLGVASAYAGRRPHDALLLLTGSAQANAYPMPERMDFVKVPAMPLRHLYDDLPDQASPAGPERRVVYIREAVALATVQAFAPHLMVVDHAPAGLFRELARSIHWLKTAMPDSRLALLMRDITFSAEQTRTIWTNEGIYPLLEGVYDEILVYGDQAVFDPVSEYGLSEAAAARTTFTGYLTPQPALRSPAQVRAELDAGDRLLLAASVGGGADGGPVLRALLEGWQTHAPSDLAGYVVLGPLLPAEDRTAIVNLAAGLPQVRISDFDADYLAAAAAADVLVSMAGYNSVCEAAHLGKRAVVVPRLPGPEEQVIRARAFERQGLVTTVDPETLSPASLWAAITSELASGASPGVKLAFGGEQAIVDRLVHHMAEK